MRFPQKFRYIWWGILLIIFLSIVIIRRDSLTKSPNSFDIAIAIALAIVVFIPFFSEFTIMGVGVKERPEEKSELDTKKKENKPTVEVNSSQVSDANSDNSKTTGNETSIIDNKEDSDNDWLEVIVKKLKKENIKSLDEEFEKNQENEHDSLKKIKNKAYYLYNKYKIGDLNALSELKIMADKYKSSEVYTNIMVCLGFSYQESNDFIQAIDAFNQAINLAKTDDGKAFLIKKVSDYLYSLGDKEGAYRNIILNISELSEDKSKSMLYSALAELYKRDKMWDMVCLAYEYAILYEPNNESIKFDAAYAYSQINLNQVSALHYTTLLRFNPKHSMAMNNLGVAYENLNLTSSAIQEFKKASAIGNTLASSNLIKHYIFGSFLEEADQLLEEARKREDVHANIGVNIEKISKLKAEEEDNLQNIQYQSIKQQGFLRILANKVFSEGILQLQEEWLDQDSNKYTVKISGSEINIAWGEDRDAKAIIGSIRGEGATCIYKEMGYEIHLSKYTLVEKGKAYLYQDSNTIKIMISYDKNIKYLELLPLGPSIPSEN